MLLRTTDQQRKHTLAETEEVIKAAAPLAIQSGSRAETEEQLAKLPLPKNFGSMATYFAPQGFLDPRDLVMQVLCEWYITAHSLWQDVVVNGVVHEDEPPVHVDFRLSYAGWMRAHGVDPEQGQRWNVFYSNLRALGYLDAPTLEFFFNLRGNSHAIVNGRD